MFEHRNPELYTQSNEYLEEQFEAGCKEDRHQYVFDTRGDVHKHELEAEAVQEGIKDEYLACH